RGGCDLHEHGSPDELRMHLEQALDRAEAFEDALGVIHAIDAHAELHVGTQALGTKHARAARRDIELARGPYRGPLHRDRIMLDAGDAAAIRDDRRFVLDPCFEIAVDRIDEVLAMEARVKA